MEQLDQSVHQRFSSRLGFILSVIGIAVGTGNIWRFPRIAAQNGSDTGAGAFLVAWVIFLFLWSIPLVMAEYALGRKCRMGVVGTITKIAGEKFAWMGAFMTFVTAAITFFYSVIVGWCIYYFIQMLINPLPMSTETAMKTWDSYQQGGWPLITHAVVMGLGMLAIWRGITSIEKINKLLIPILLTIVICSVIRALTLPGAWAGVGYLFTPEWRQLAQPKIWMEALTQNAWDVGAGWGLYLTYAAYIKREHGIVKNAFITPIANNTVSLLAALMVFGTVFAVLQTEMSMARPEVLEIMKTSGPASTGLTFIWMPQLFERMFLGRPLAILFFLGLTFAGFSSLIAQLELPVRVCIDAGLKRSRAILMVVVISWIVGIPSAIHLKILTNQDFVWGYALLISGALVAFGVMRYGVTRLRKEELCIDENDWKLGRWWDIVLMGFVPLGAVVLLVWWLVKEARPGQWYNPFDPTSVMNCLLQWFVVLFILIMTGRRLGRRSVKISQKTNQTNN
ncbi:MAG: sodium:calcium symporter [Phycisphaerae bacterium SM23_30]|nr:MAG: sodium:calcium symporter [Phycisphaerae bacterium SM23_30]